MCGNIANIVRSVRGRCELPIGTVVSLEALDSDFQSISREQRGQFSRKVLAALPNDHRENFKNKLRRSLGKDLPLDQPVLELGTFLAIGHYAIENDKSVSEVVEMIVAQRSGAGIIYASI